MSHHMTECPECKTIWEQCRCPDENKQKTIAICPACEEKATKPADATTVDKIAELVANIKAVGNADPETSHVLQDELYVLVLEAIRDGKAADPAAAAAAALEVEKLKLCRWYA